jgi:hypothetical protein
MARNGLHLKSGGGIAGRYVFEAGEPADVVYRLDFRHPILAGRGRAAHRQGAGRPGWEHVQEVLGWEYLRKRREPGGENEIYADRWARAGKYRRLLLMLGIADLCVASTMPFHGSLERGGGIRVFASGLLPMLCYAILRIGLRMREALRS